jgi:hypothetical protein
LDNLTTIACKLLFEDGQNPMLRVADRVVQQDQVVDAIVSHQPFSVVPCTTAHASLRLMLVDGRFRHARPKT